MSDGKGSCCGDPFADLPPELRPRTEGGELNVLRRVTCPGCGLTYQTNRETDLCPACERKQPPGHDRPPAGERECNVMMNIKVIGVGCANCERLERMAHLAVEQIQAEQPGFQAEIEKVTDFTRFMDYGVMATPGLVVNGRLVSSGRVPAPRAIAEWLREAAAAEA